MAMPKPKDCYNIIFIYSEDPTTIQNDINVMQFFDSTQETLDILVY